MNVKVSHSNTPTWETVSVSSHIPAELKKLDEMAHNLWWTWNQEGKDLFSSIDKELYSKVGRNPVELLRSLDYERLKTLSKDPELIKRMNKCYEHFRAYMDVKPDKSVVMHGIWNAQLSSGV